MTAINLLAIDTSTRRSVLVLLTRAGDVRVPALVRDDDPKHGRMLVKDAIDLLKSAGLKLRDLDVIGVGLGPGSYTGLRIGLTAVKMWSYVAGTPVVSFDSLEAVARGVAWRESRVSVVADAQRQDLYVADFARALETSAFDRLGPTRIMSAEEWSRVVEPGTLVLGPASARARRLVPHAQFAEDPALDLPSAPGMITLALAAWAEGRFEDVARLEPNYFRRSAAEDKADAAPAV